MEIVDNINLIMELNVQDVDSIVATPKGSKVVLTASMKDGSSSNFVMVRNRKDGSTSIIAQNH